MSTPAPDPLLMHEALDRAYTITVMVDELLVKHDGVARASDAVQQALVRLVDAAADLYQAIGSEHG